MTPSEMTWVSSVKSITPSEPWKLLRAGSAADLACGAAGVEGVGDAGAIGAGLAAVAGLLYAVQAGQINPYMGFTPVLKAFIAAVIGGFGSIAGAVLGGFVLGFLEVLVTALSGIGDLLPAGSVPPEVRAFLQQWLPSSLASYRDAVVFIVLILVLLVRPQGILGRRDQGDLE